VLNIVEHSAKTAFFCFSVAGLVMSSIVTTYLVLISAAFVQKRPIVTVVDGFVHLQQYLVTEIADSGLGSYSLRQGFPLCDKSHAVH